MKRRLFAAGLFGLLFAAAPVHAKGNCLERCSENLMRCSSRCNLDAKCMRRCDDQMNSCNNSCGQSGETGTPLPKKCPDDKGRMVPCDVYQTPSSKSPKPPSR